MTTAVASSMSSGYRPTDAYTTEATVAVSVQSVSKWLKSFRFRSAASSSNERHILNDITFNVRKGTICGLLGPSGCGKTTLLNCIVSQRSFNRGAILLFGHPTGSKESGIPGRRVGFMPQEIALGRDLKVGETLTFYGTLLGMNSMQIDNKGQFLSNLLDLPPFDRFIGSLSGGQQRRVSLAITLIHDPELVILDEPTVGVDPIVRKRIWDHLYDLALQNNQTIIITTHYIEEASMAHMVQMMYDGSIICDGSPKEVIERNNCSSLEDVFLKLCLKLDRKKLENDQTTEQRDATPLLKSDRRSSSNTGEVLVVELSLINDNISCGARGLDKIETLSLPRLSFFDKAKMCLRPPTFSRVKALTTCNLRKSYRHVGHFLMHVIAPCIIMIVFQLTFGGFPKRVPLGVVNEDLEELGATLMSHVDSDNIMLRYYSTYDEGRRAVQVGETWGILHIQANFSNSLFHRFMHGSMATNDTLTGSSLTLAMDVTCHPVTVVVLDSLNEAFIKFGLDLLDGTGLEPAVVSSPLAFRYDIYDRETGGLMGFAAPGIIICGVYFVAMANCVLSLLSDKSSGQFTRNIVAGITEMELLLGNMAAFSVGVLIQVLTYVVLAFWIMGIVCEGPLYAVFILILLHGLCGTAYGLFVSTFCGSEFTAIMLGFGSFLPSVCLSGIVWPIESVPSMLQTLCRMIPQSFVVESVRAIMKRGWTIDHPVVIYGIVANLSWLTIFLLVSAVLLRIK